MSLCPRYTCTYLCMNICNQDSLSTLCNNNNNDDVIDDVVDDGDYFLIVISAVRE
uniref:Uncharacterized protein n=1 Tax=Arion vulgaris TaxID=1028688 RepID=A0A0B7BAY4_9EUPU